MTVRALALIACLLLAGVAHADDEADADRTFHAALSLQGEPAIEAFEYLGATRPITRWTDDAWAEAARLAERAGDFARARRDLAQVLAVSDDEQLVRRTRATLARLAAITGPSGQWDSVAAKHERLITALAGGGSPRPALEQLEALVRDHPDYPRATAVRLAIAQGWERDGDAARGLAVLREAVATAGADRVTARMALARASIRDRDLVGADEQLAALAAEPGADQAAIGEVRAQLAAAEHRSWLRWLLRGVLAALAIAAIVALRRGAGTWRAVAQRLARPPIEVLFLAPIAIVLAAIAWTGNPLVARAVRQIALAGLAIAWLSGVLLEHSARSARRTVVQAALAMLAVAAAAYLALDHDHMLDLIVETWRSGPAPR